ncbi:flavodoxin domain-containing protein [Halopiger thermotolerans]
MVSILVIYATGEGQTATVAERIGTVFEDRGHDATTIDVDTRPADLERHEYDAVLVGESMNAIFRGGNRLPSGQQRDDSW